MVILHEDSVCRAASLQEEQCLPSLLSPWPDADQQGTVWFLFWLTICCTPCFGCGPPPPAPTAPGTYCVRFSFCPWAVCYIWVLSTWHCPGTCVGRKDREEVWVRILNWQTLRTRGDCPSSPFSLCMLSVVIRSWEGRVSPMGAQPPRAGDGIKWRSLVLQPGVFPLVILNIFLNFHVLGQSLAHLNVYVYVHMRMCPLLICFLLLLI